MFYLDKNYFELDIAKSGFTLSNQKYYTGKKVTADDSTIINVFYKRKLFTIEFTYGTETLNTATFPEGTVGGRKYANDGSAENNDAYAYYDAANKMYYIVGKKDQSISGLWPRPKNSTGSKTVIEYKGTGATSSVQQASTVHEITKNFADTSDNKVSIAATWSTTTNILTMHYWLEPLEGASAPGAKLARGRYYTDQNKYTESFISNQTGLSPKDIAGFTNIDILGT